MSNKYLLSDKSKLLHNRLEKLSNRLIDARNLDDMATNEQIISESIRALNSLYKDLTAPTFNPQEIIVADLPDPNLYNHFFQLILDDLSIIFSELENIETLSVSNFNFASVEANKLYSRLQTVSSKLGDYILYSEDTSQSGLYFTDSFNNTSRIDTDSALLNDLECNINPEEGIITLPINKDKTILINITQTPIIDEENSNGEVGNNQQIDSSGSPGQKHNNINVILDNNPDTWFEYERVDTIDTGESLRLDLTINLGEPQIINHIEISPNNFGTRTAVKVLDITTSLDGLQVSETSIKDDIPVVGFSTEDEENIFNLAPSTSKYAGKGIYTFTPRKVKYVRVILEQTEPYTIDTTNGIRYRYAIGLRDINIYSLVFEPKGELISSVFQSINEVKKVILDTSQNPSAYSELASIQYYISPDNGQSWNEIQPKDFLGRSGVVSDIPEILNLNTVDSGSVSTTSPAKTLRLKSVLNRNDENFTEERAASLQQTTDFASELHSIPTEPPFSFDIEKTPLEGSLAISQPFAGSRGKNATDFDFRGFELKDSGAGSQSYSIFGKLAESPAILRPYKKVGDNSSPTEYNTVLSNISDFIKVYVAGEEWSQATQPLASYNDQYGSNNTSKVFNLDLDTATISFGNGQNSLSVPEGAYIGIYFDAEKLFFEKVGDDYFAKLNFRTGLQKDDLVLQRYSPVKTNVEVLKKDLREIHLEYKNILDTSDIESSFSGTKKTFLNGNEELSSDGDYSIDIDNGIIYLYTSLSSDTSIEYTYQLIEKLSDTDWYWSDDFSGIFIRARAFEIFTESNLILPSNDNSYIFHLAHLNVIEKSPRFVVVDKETLEPIDSSLNPFEKEVDFIDGEQELYVEGKYPEKIEAILNITSIEPTGRSQDNFSISICAMEFDIPITNDTSYPFSFDNNLGVDTLTEKDTYEDLYDIGDYYLDRENNVLYFVFLNSFRVKRTGYYAAAVYLANVGNAFGSIIYYKKAESGVESDGLYSIDYKNGIVYTDKSSNSDWSIKVGYDYCDYRAYYNIAKEVPSTSYFLEGKTITINPDEILGKYAQPSQRANLYYQVNYKYPKSSRTDIPELKDYFTPVLKSYSLRMITEKDLF